MDDLRDKIAAVIGDAIDSVHGMDVTHADYARAAADAIIAALPGMVAPLVWCKHPSSEIWRCDTALGTYKVFGVGPKPSWDFDGLTVQSSAMAESVESAKAAANAHNAAAVVAAFKGVAP